MTASAIGVLMLVGIDGRTLDASALTDDSASTITLFNNVVVAMICIFAAIMVVNAVLAMLSDRRQEFSRLRLLGATPQQVRTSVVAEAAIVALVGVAMGCVASLATVVPFAVARRGGRGARRAAVAATADRGRYRRPGDGRQPHCRREHHAPGTTAVTDSMFMGTTNLLAPIASVQPAGPVKQGPLSQRLRLTLVSTGLALLGIPVALALAIGSVLAVSLGIIVVGVVVALAVVPTTEALAALHRRISGALLDQEITAGYAETGPGHLLGRPFVWLRDPARWRDVGFTWFSATGGFVMSALPVVLLVAPAVHLVGAVFDGSLLWWLLVLWTARCWACGG